MPSPCLRAARLRLLVLATCLAAGPAASQTEPAAAPAKRPNILVIFGDDLGQSNVSAYSRGVLPIGVHAYYVREGG